MKVTEKINREVEKMADGTVFKYQQLGISQSEYSAAAKAIERLISKGIIKRSSTGIFYKPKQSVFGELQPRDEELLRLYLFENGKRIAYITGAMLYNQMGLSTQIPNVVKVACKSKRITSQIESLNVKSVKSYVEVDNENYILLQLLDALKDFTNISDVDKKSAVTILKNKIDNLKKDDLPKILNYALKYPPRTRAFLGAILDYLQKYEYVDKLKEKLNPLTNYKLGLKRDILPTAINWNII